MKNQFSKRYIRAQRGCYSPSQVDALPFINDSKIDLFTLHTHLPIKDFTWFLAHKTNLTLKQKRALALHCAEFVLPIYEKDYPDDKRVSNCIKATKKFLAGLISRDELLLHRRNAAYAAAYAAAAADAAYAAAAAYAAYAADAAYAAAAAYAAYAAAAYAAYAAAADAAYPAAYAADAARYRAHIWKWVEKELVKS